MRRNIRIGCLVACLLAGLLAAAPAHAASPGTKGAAQAAFHAYITGGQKLAESPALELGAPSFGDSDMVVRPFDDYDGMHVCQSEWVLLVSAWFDGNFPEMEVRTTQQILSDISAVTISLQLDGAPLTTKRTAVKRFLAFPTEWNIFVFQQGAAIAPGTLSVGLHRLSVVVDDPVFGSFESSIKFRVDAAGTGACLA